MCMTTATRMATPTPTRMTDMGITTGTGIVTVIIPMVITRMAMITHTGMTTHTVMLIAWSIFTSAGWALNGRL